MECNPCVEYSDTVYEVTSITNTSKTNVYAVYARTNFLCCMIRNILVHTCVSGITT
jgi:hypothetical protein